MRIADRVHYTRRLRMQRWSYSAKRCVAWPRLCDEPRDLDWIVAIANAIFHWNLSEAAVCQTRRLRTIHDCLCCTIFRVQIWLFVFFRLLKFDFAIFHSWRPLLLVRANFCSHTIATCAHHCWANFSSSEGFKTMKHYSRKTLVSAADFSGKLSGKIIDELFRSKCVER